MGRTSRKSTPPNMDAWEDKKRGHQWRGINHPDKWGKDKLSEAVTTSRQVVLSTVEDPKLCPNKIRRKLLLNQTSERKRSFQPTILFFSPSGFPKKENNNNFPKQRQPRVATMKLICGVGCFLRRRPSPVFFSFGRSRGRRRVTKRGREIGDG